MESRFVKMTPPEGATSCGWAGESYDVDDDNTVTVPEEALSDLMSHGYKPAPDAVEEEVAEAIVAKKSKRKGKE